MQKIFIFPYFVLAIVFFIPACMTNAKEPAPLVENANKLQLARHLLKTYIDPLKLTGRTGESAIQTMMREGFLCEITTDSIIIENDLPKIACRKEPSGFGHLCNDFFVTIRLLPEQKVSTNAELFKQLNILKVARSSAICPYPPELSTDFVRHRPYAEKTLANYIANLNILNKELDSAYETMLVDGYYCGFAPDDSAQQSTSPKMLCTKRQPGIKYCFEQQIVLDIAWADATATTEKLLQEMANATVKGITSSCAVPTQ